MTTIYDVARLAKVSPATVSRVFNGTPVSAERAERVRAAAEQLSYVANRTARSLRRRSSEMIALIIPDIENPFFTSIARGVGDRARAAGYSVVLCNTDEDLEEEARYLDVAVLEHMAGVILAAASDHSDLSRIVASERPLVAVDRRSHTAEVDAVLLDNAAGGAAATEALIARGFTRIACITGPADVETAEDRLSGWSASLSTAGLDAPDLVRHANYRVDGGREAMAELLSVENPPDAVFVANNMMAVGALQVLYEAGLSPQSFGVASFGDMPYTALSPSGTNVIHLPARELGVTAADLLLQRIDGYAEPPRTVVLPNSL